MTDRVSFLRDSSNEFTDRITARLGHRASSLNTLLNSLALAQDAVRVPLAHDAQPGSARDARAALEALAAGGWVTIEWGSRATGRETEVRPTPQLIALLAEITATRALEIPTRCDYGRAILRDADKREVVIPNGKRLELERSLRDFNRKNTRHTWTIEHPGYGHLGARVPWHDVTLIDRSVLVYDRVFSRTLKQGGRFYSQLQSAVPSKDRRFLRVGGEPLVELDYKSLQPRIIFDERGLTPPDDCYAVPGVPRAAVKQLLLIAMNTRSRASAVAAFVADWNERAAAEPEVQTYTRAEAGELLDRVLQELAPIADTFYSEAGLRLQYVDSNICARVMTDMAAARIPLLAIHDGFLVPVSRVDELHAAMLAAYRKVVRRDATPVIARNDLT